MDEIVKAAIAKWPNVPHCCGWLGLDARGNWYLRDDEAQAAGTFCDSTKDLDPARKLASKGSLLQHEKLIGFIERNYECEDVGPLKGQWFFQNGPQRVYVELEATPFVWRIAGAPDFEVISHTGQVVRAQRCVIDEHGRLYLEAELGFGLVHSLDMLNAADALESGLWVPQDMLTRELPQRFGYVRSPQAFQKI